MKEYEILTRSLKDSAAHSKLKLLKEGETFGVEKPGGEKRIHIGSMSEEKKWDGFFFPNGGNTFNVIVSKIDLIKYMFDVKNEYFNPHQSYRLKISDFYNDLYNQTLGISQESFEICFEKNTDKSRYYLTRPSGNVLSNNYKYIIDICLPVVTKFVFLRVKDGKSYVFYLKPEFKPDFTTPNIVKNNLTYEDSLQRIFYGAPGTGKSHEIKEKTQGHDVIRTTFHPDSDYSTFVGAYKPIMGDPKPIYGFDATGKTAKVEDPKGTIITEQKIEYKFVKQAFLKAYLKAWRNYTDTTVVATTATASTLTPVASPTAPIEGDDGELIIPKNPNLKNENTIRETELIEEPSYNPVFLIIEEINRGNCAQIFGDIFQLLDRQGNGFSEYPIEADSDLQKEIDNAFKNEKEYKLDGDIDVDGVVKGYVSNHEDGTLSKDIQGGRILLLPPNLYIWATMNTSDQSLFPIDSAFKRRWEWKYIPIGYKNDHWEIKIGEKKNEKKYKWVDFQREINSRIYSIDNSEDKLLGDFFVDANRTGNVISSDTLLNKILFYIWNDVCKDDPDQIFRWKDDKDDNKEKSIRFSDFFCDEKDRKLQGLMSFLDVKAEGVTPVISTGAEESETDVVPEKGDSE